MESEKYAGIYEVSEAARIIRTTSKFLETPYLINNRHVLRWIRKGLSLPALKDVPADELSITFADLISMRVIALLRIAGMTWKQIHITERWVRRNTESPRPFATERFWTGFREAYTEHEGKLVAASLGGQYPLPDMIEAHLMPVAGLTFGESGVADSWVPLPVDAVIMRPSVQFGAPCLKGTRITTRTLWDMSESGDSPEFIARVYDLEPEKVKEAIAWEQRLTAA